MNEARAQAPGLVVSAMGIRGCLSFVLECCLARLALGVLSFGHPVTAADCATYKTNAGQLSFVASAPRSYEQAVLVELVASKAAMCVYVAEDHTGGKMICPFRPELSDELYSEQRDSIEYRGNLYALRCD